MILDTIETPHGLKCRVREELTCRQQRLFVRLQRSYDPDAHPDEAGLLALAIAVAVGVEEWIEGGPAAPWPSSGAEADYRARIALVEDSYSMRQLGPVAEAVHARLYLTETEAGN